MTGIADAADRSPPPAVPQAPVRSLRERWCAWRDARLCSPAFQRFATAFPLTRPIARRRARDLFDLCAGFVYTQVLFSCVRLRVFEQLQAGPLALEDLAARIQLPLAGAQRLVRAAVALRLLENRDGGRIGLGALGAALRGNPGVQAMVEHHALLYGDLQDPLPLLRGERDERALSAYWAYAEGAAPAALTTEQVAPYSALMSASQHFVATEILAAYDFGAHRRMLDVGGGEGTFAISVAAQAPALHLTVFDLPAVARIAEARLAATGLSARSAAVGGSFVDDPLPAGADLITLIRVAYDHDDARVLALLKKIHATLPADGTLLLAEPMRSDGGDDPMADAYFGFYLRALGRGRARSFDEFRDLLAAAGFTRVERLRSRAPLLTSLITARR
jgi:demethylspheroidene O-methyltransferase